MADLSITAANVKAGGSNCRTRLVQFGETVTAGQSVYQSTADTKYYKADANASSTAAAATAIVLTGAASDAYGVVAYEGDVIIGATTTNGVPYIVSTTAGGIAPASDFSGYSGSYLQHIGYAISSTVIRLNFFTTGATN